MTSELPAWKPDPRSPVLIGDRYQLLDDIGQGATSLIYKARDVTANRVVALKVLRGSAANHPRLSANFRREAEVGSRIVHPNVIQIYDSGVHDGWLYLVMEYVNGRTLADVLSMCSRLSIAECEPLVRQTLAALECIHAHGIVHRDVKPSNIMATQDGVWKLMDFGIAREQGSDATVGPSLGTPEYMSPERLLGRAATPAADLYAAGVLFYEALAGETPFRDCSPVQRCTLPPPGLRALRPDAPQWLDGLIRRAMAPDAAARYPDAASMIRDLGAFESAEPVKDIAADPDPVPAAVPTATVPSHSIVSLLEDDPAPLHDALGLMAESLRCLINLEAAGSSHEPLSPHTLRLTPSGRIEISPHGPAGDRDTLLVSTPKYTAPEMMRGRPLDSPGARVQADLYALGFVMYEFVLGRRLFHAEFPSLDDPGAGLGWMEWHTDPARKAKPVATLVPGTPPLFSQLLERLLEKDPRKRCATYDEAYRAVQDLIGRTQQTQRVPLPPASPKAKPSRPHLRTGLIACGFAAILLAVLALLARLLR
jgi:eukaryotic-like serine/threonine-protein kinase